EQQQKSVRIDLIVEECLNLLRASLPSTIRIRQDIKSESVAIMADPSQIHQVIMNLCTNAAHAMGEKEGTLEVGLYGVDLDADAASIHVDLHKGSYLQLSVSDSGHGMDKVVMARLFDPFFTTKEQGKGTGLGLSVAHGIVKDHGGAITVDSNPGEGTTFRVFLPRIPCVEDSMPIEVAEPVNTGSERILLVDDEEDLVFAGRKMLERVGYDVVVTTDGRQALDLFRHQPSRFDLILTDLTMPHLTGADLAREVLRIRPDIPIILCTGFSSGSGGSISHQEARAMGIRELVTKPFDRTEMTGILRRVLDESRQTALTT
ncbi:MAG TPA: ATP-binding protein, partial [Desulfuromonadales bacterium]|nr:ATP-binding protein [Desulfuromonadales bacterium]